MARPTKLTKVLIKKLSGYIAKGNYQETACYLAGVSPSTFYNWKVLAERVAAGETDENADLLLEFLESIKKAEAKAEAKRIALIDKQAADDWRAAAWYLERRYPKRWGRSDRLNVEASGPDGGAIPLETTIRPDLSNLSLEELEVLHGIVSKLEAATDQDTD